LLIVFCAYADQIFSDSWFCLTSFLFSEPKIPELHNCNELLFGPRNNCNELLFGLHGCYQISSAFLCTPPCLLLSYVCDSVRGRKFGGLWSCPSCVQPLANVDASPATDRIACPTSKAVRNPRESSKQVTIQNLSGRCAAVFWAVWAL
jgi:hypothetical protein